MMISAQTTGASRPRSLGSSEIVAAGVTASKTCPTVAVMEELLINFQEIDAARIFIIRFQKYPVSQYSSNVEINK